MAARYTNEPPPPILIVDKQIFRVTEAVLHANGAQRELSAWVNAEFARRAADLRAELEMWKAKALARDEILQEIREMRAELTH